MNPIMLSTVLAATLATSCAREAKPTPKAVPAARAPQSAQPPMRGASVGAANELTAFVDPGDALRRPVLRAIAVLHGANGQRLGTVELVETGHEGLDLFATIAGLPPGTHAYHVHVYGDCSSADLLSAGPHFHFTGSSLDRDVKMITGNLGELTADAEGHASHRTRLAYATLQGPFSLLGRAVIVHARGNDPTVTPDGGAGARLACGVIGVANPGGLDERGRTPTAVR